MRTSSIVAGAAAFAAGAVVLYLRSQKSQAFRSSVRQRASASAAWLRGHQQELHEGFDRLEEQIAQLGDEMRARLDELRRQAAGAVQPDVDLEEWSLGRSDVQHDLRGLQRR